MDKIVLESKVYFGKEVKIIQASDFKELVIDGIEILITSTMQMEFDNSPAGCQLGTVKLTNQAGEYLGLIPTALIANKINNACMLSRVDLLRELQKKGVMVKS